MSLVRKSGFKNRIAIGGWPRLGGSGIASNRTAQSLHYGVRHRAGGLAWRRNKTPSALLPKEIGGRPVSYASFDDATDPAVAAKNVRKCIEEQKADVLIGSST